MSTNFQSVSKTTGDRYEQDIANSLLKNGLILYDKNYTFDDLGMEIDLILYNPEVNRYEYHECKGGKHGANKRPGAKRTDNVKKAIANGWLLKNLFPESYYVVYFSDSPNPHSSSETMLKVACDAGVINEVRYQYYEEPDESFLNDLFIEE